MREGSKLMQLESGISHAKLLALGVCVACVSFAGFKLAATFVPSGPASLTVASQVSRLVMPAGVQVEPPSVAHWEPEPVAATPTDPAVATPDPVLTVSSDIPTVSPIEEVQHRIARGETISEVFSVHGIGAAEAESWIKAADKVYDLDRIYAGQRLVLTIDRARNELTSLHMEIDPETNLVARRSGSLAVVATRETTTFDRGIRVVNGRIMSSFYAAAADGGVPDKVISEVADILGWNINFATDMRPGAEFRIIYEELTRPGSTKKSAGRVLAVQLENRNRIHEGIYFASADGSAEGYYDRTGKSLGRDFLRYPVAFTRISSHFSAGRFHPVLKRNRPHYGVDFAAPTGTPVRSVADGVVEMSGWHGGNGRFVKVKHGDVYKSGYSHLSRIASKVTKGAHVQKGQVIGYVGSSGLATGPHLHFAMYRRGDYINPLDSEMPRSRSLAGTDLAGFRTRVVRLDDVYVKAETSGENLAMVASVAGL
ncbi:MAG: murein DD-endopeptidase MepM/ murein hydrolase activator NlpD [Hyphomicrobiaceae bacterium]|jgi:murein DD-endopeptidase MepM/ murein hydrolase activator NlpD